MSKSNLKTRQFKKLVLFAPIILVYTKIILGYDFGTALRIIDISVSLCLNLDFNSKSVFLEILHTLV